MRHRTTVAPPPTISVSRSSSHNPLPPTANAGAGVGVPVATPEAVAPPPDDLPSSFVGHVPQLSIEAADVTSEHESVHAPPLDRHSTAKPQDLLTAEARPKLSSVLIPPATQMTPPLQHTVRSSSRQPIPAAQEPRSALMPRARNVDAQSVLGGKNRWETGSVNSALAPYLDEEEEEMITTHDPEFSLPWDYRRLDDVAQKVPLCDFTSKLHFWKRVQWAVQFCLCACVPAAALTFSPATRKWFRAPGNVLSFCVSCTNNTTGRALSGLKDIARAMFITLLMLLFAFGVKLNRHWAVWGAAYFLEVLSLAFFTRGLVSINTLLLITIGMVTHYAHKEEGVMFPCLLIRDSLIGAGLGTLSAIFPLPNMNHVFGSRCVGRLATSASVCLMGLAESFFLQSNVQRTDNLIKLRYAFRRMGEDLEELETNITFGYNEPVLGLKIAELEARHKLFSDLRGAIGSMMAVVDFIQANPQRVVSCEASSVFQRQFRRGFEQMANAIDRQLHVLCWRRASADDAARLTLLRNRVMTKYNNAMRSAIEVAAGAAGVRDEAIESDIKQFSNFPRTEIGFFAFNMHFALSVVTNFTEPDIWDWGKRFRVTFTSPLIFILESWQSFVDLLHWRGPAVTQFVYGLKMAFTMTSTAGFLLYIDSPDPVYSGAAVIGFVSGSDASQTVQTSIIQVIGTVFGNVFGYLLASINSSTWWLVFSVGIFALLSGFFRSSNTYGLAALFAQFAAFGAIQPSLDAASALQSIQQNVGAVVWYGFITAAILPTRPSRLLWQEMTNGFEQVKAAIGDMELVLKRRASLAESGEVDTSEKPDFAGALRVSLRLQRNFLGGAAVEPNLAAKPFPAFAVDNVVSQEAKIVALLAPLAAACVLTAGHASQSQILPVVAPHLTALSHEVETLMGLLILLLDRDVATLTRLLVSSCVRLEEISNDLSRAELEFSYRFARGTADEPFGSESENGGDDLAAAGSAAPSIHTILYCCSSLSHELFQLYLCTSEMRHAIEAM